MKNRLLRLAVVLGLAWMVVGVSNCHGPGHGIVILPCPLHPALEEKWSTIEGKLKSYDQGVYRIQLYHEGDPVGKPSGEMPEILLERTPAEFNDLAKKCKFTGHAFQVGIGLNDIDNDFRFVGCESEGGATPNGTHTHHIQASSKGSSHSHVIHLLDQSASAVTAITPIVDEAVASEKSPSPKP